MKLDYSAVPRMADGRLYQPVTPGHRPRAVSGADVA